MVLPNEIVGLHPPSMYHGPRDVAYGQLHNCEHTSIQGPKKEKPIMISSQILTKMVCA